MSETKILLSEQELPVCWYNIQADMPRLPRPPLHPVTGKPVGPDDLKAIFPMSLIEQEMSRERWIEIPEEVRNIYRLWRPSPLFRAHRLEKVLDTPARIFYKYEGVSPAGSHKLNTAVPQAYFNKKEGIKRLTTETGAGQWGVALSQACNFFGLECTVYMVKVSYQQKPYRRSMMEIFGAEVCASPSEHTAAGRKILSSEPDSPGSLGIAISEAVEDAAGREDTNYALGSVLNHVLLHQTVIGLEAREQMARAGYYPDVVIACCGGGSNFGGLAFPFVHDRLVEGTKVRLVAVEPSACPTLTRGRFAYDFGDVAGLTPLLSMYTLGAEFIPPGIHAGGLRYHGDSPLVSQLVHDGIVEARAFNQTDVFKSAVMFARSEGIVPAPESAHAIACAIQEALAAREAGEARTILFNLSGHGLLDLPSYDAYLAGKLEDYPLPEEELARSLARLPGVNRE
ncbi:TrpB-like pyridoxal phosphate-dependent enzyme [Desulfofundulus thermocisternus]|uniref:TrpB-like pyridoxal phosphate-dependent enzyme n=1 Tax=Desulfofundulus thermocisternus TaxID=42471 RepID=UPI00217D09A1|nr:TrpB-like pyridoxal phosphate-dependent enzyme [Desulfofundulus thermocisternus]MCS5696573.1 TrpB-like pyridoxal phosphate-dependent enzyme [Desulfofundulus thermocisternus]